MTYEEQVEAIAKALYAEQPVGWASWSEANVTEKIRFRRWARVSLNAVNIEPPKPKWPTDESVQAICRQPLSDQIHFETRREWMRKAMLVDPIIKAAIAQRDYLNSASVDAVSRAVNEAGL